MAVFFDLGVYKFSAIHGTRQSTQFFVPRGRYGFDDQNDKKNKVKASIWNEEPPQISHCGEADIERRYELNPYNKTSSGAVRSEEGRPTRSLVIQDMDPGEDCGYDRGKPQGYKNQ